MKIGVIGIGGIAQKAYLPTYAKMRKEASFIFATRNDETRDKISREYNFVNTVATIDELLAEKIDACFIHVATKVHFEIAKQCLEALTGVLLQWWNSSNSFRKSMSFIWKRMNRIMR